MTDLRTAALAAHRKMTDSGWIDVTSVPTLRLEYRLGLVRLEYHATCEVWRAKVGGNEWGYTASTPETALERCPVPPPAVDDVLIAVASLASAARAIPVQAVLL